MTSGLCSTERIECNKGHCKVVDGWCDFGSLFSFGWDFYCRDRTKCREERARE